MFCLSPVCQLYVFKHNVWEKAASDAADGQYLRRRTDNGMPLEKYDIKNGQKEGVYLEYYPNGTVRLRVHYQNGKREGSYEGYYDDGKIMIRCYYKDDKKEGLHCWYHKNGRILEQKNYEEGKITGEIEYFRASGIKVDAKPQKLNIDKKKDCAKIEASFDKERTMANHLYHSNGNLKKEYSYNKNNQLEGLCVTYYASGQLQEECAYRNGNLNGAYRSWYENGRLQKKCTYLNGEYEGAYESYHPNGQLWIRVSYEKGKTEGLLEKYTEKGQLAYAVFCLNGSVVHMAGEEKLATVCQKIADSAPENQAELARLEKEKALWLKRFEANAKRAHLKQVNQGLRRVLTDKLKAIRKEYGAKAWRIALNDKTVQRMRQQIER